MKRVKIFIKQKSEQFFYDSKNYLKKKKSQQTEEKVWEIKM